MRTSTRLWQRWSMLLLLIVFISGQAAAQKISFGVYTTSAIALTKSGDISFNAKYPIIAGNSDSMVTIALGDNEAQYVQIVGDATRDITITVTAPAYLTVGTGSQIPFACKFAYSNRGSLTEAAARLSAVEVPAGFTSITLPVFRRASGAPAPPPTPAHGGYTPPSATAYLFLYGTLGPVGNVNAGYLLRNDQCLR